MTLELLMKADTPPQTTVWTGLFTGPVEALMATTD